MHTGTGAIAQNMAIGVWMDGMSLNFAGFAVICGVRSIAGWPGECVRCIQRVYIMSGTIY